MILNRKQIAQLAKMAGYDVIDISGSSLEEEFRIHKGTLLNQDTDELLSGIIAEHADYPEDITDILEP